MISVLCPSRGRPDALMASATGLMDLAAGDVEFLTAADPDDSETQETGRCLDRLWVAPERYGYARIHEYYNRLAEMAQGEWLLLWNDDAQMLTPGWDEIIAEQSPAILWPGTDYSVELNTFPVVPAAWARHLGHLGLDQSVDMWLHHLGVLTGLMRRIPVQIHHARAEGDATAADRDVAGAVNTFWLPGKAEARERDAAKLLELVP